jgi:hypothetical protein
VAGEVPHVPAKHNFTLRLQFVGHRVPALDDRLPGLEELRARRVGKGVGLRKPVNDVVELLAQRIRPSMTILCFRAASSWAKRGGAAAMCARAMAVR